MNSGTRPKGLVERLLAANSWIVYTFFYAPIFVLVFFSFNDNRNVGVWTHASLRWYGELAQSHDIIRSVRNSLIVATVATIVSTVIGTAAALSMERFRYRGQRTYDALLYLPIIIPDVTMAVMMLLFFVQAFGITNNLLGTRIELGLGSISLAHIAFDISFVAVVVRAAPRRDGLESGGGGSRPLRESLADVSEGHPSVDHAGSGRRGTPRTHDVARRRGGHQLRHRAGVDDSARVRVRPREEGCDAARQCRVDAHAGSVDVAGCRLALLPAKKPSDRPRRRDC